MHLKSLSVRNFLAFDALDLKLGPVTLIVASNATGKTAICDAIQFVLLGTARGVVRQNRAAVLGRNGADKYTVKIETDGGTMARSQTGRGAKTSLDPDLVQCCLDPFWIIRQDTDRRQAFFTKHLASNSETKLTLDIPDLPDDFNGVLTALVTRDLAEAEKAAVEVRRQAKRDIAADGGQGYEPDSTVTVGDTERKLSELVDRLPGMREHLVRLRGEAAILGQRYAQCSAEGLAKAKQAHTAAERAWKAAQTAKEEAYLPVSANLKTQEQAQKRLVASEKTLAGVEGELRAVQSIMAGIKGLDGEMCLASSPKLPIKCPLGAEKVKEMGVQYYAQNKGVALQVATAKQVRDQERTQLAALRKEARVMADGCEAAQNVETAAKTELARSADLVLKYDGYDKYPSLRDELNGRISTGDQLVKQVEAFQAAQAQAQERAGRLEKLKTLLDTAEKVVAQVGPDGPLRQHMASEVEEVGFDELADRWEMESLALACDGAVLLHNRPIELASRSEQYRAGILIAHRLAKKVGFLVIDEFDLLEPINRGYLAARFDAWRAEISTILLLATRGIQRPTQPHWDWFTVYELADGQLSLAFKATQEGGA